MVELIETLDTDSNIDDQIVNDDVKIAEIFNRFYSNAVIDLKIPDFHGVVPLADKLLMMMQKLLKFLTDFFLILLLT